MCVILHNDYYGLWFLVHVSTAGETSQCIRVTCINQVVKCESCCMSVDLFDHSFEAQCLKPKQTYADIIYKCMHAPMKGMYACIHTLNRLTLHTYLCDT